jgi:glycerophosphoryl diester phosphodiesterase
MHGLKRQALKLSFLAGCLVLGISGAASSDGVGGPKSAPNAQALPLVIAHRGASGYRPEHTLESYELAIAMGADYIEPDLVATQDGQLIARHENEIGGTTDAAQRFPDRKRRKQIDGLTVEGWFSEDFTLTEIKTLRARERLPGLRGTQHDGRFAVPTLAEILSLVSRKRQELGRPLGIYVETKHPTYFASLGLPLEERLVRALAQSGYTRPGDAAFIESFEPTSLRRLRKLTRLRLIQLIDDSGAPYDFVSRGDKRTFGDLITPAGLKEIAGYADGIGPSKVLIVPIAVSASGSGRLLPPTTLLADAHSQKLLVHPWTFRKEPQFLPAEYRGDATAEMVQFYRLGIDGLFTDFPDLGRSARDSAAK